MGIIEVLYSQLLDLERQQVNSIWARIIKNAFAPLFQPKFDVIAGNPPWINWESLPQRRFMSTLGCGGKTSDIWIFRSQSTIPKPM